MTATVVTAVYGSFDQLRPQAAQDVDTEWLCFTDDPHLNPPAPWQVIVEAPLHPGNPRLSAKRRKMRPPHLTDDCIWIDGSHEVTSSAFVRLALAARHDGVAVFRHPRRDDILDEAQASLGVESQSGKYLGMPLVEQARHYIAEGYPRHSGLFAAGTIAWDLSRDAVRALGLAWWKENESWTVQDQISFPVVCRRLGLDPGVFPIRQIEARGPGFLSNRWLRIHSHNR